MADDSDVWTGTNEGRWQGWLTVARDQRFQHSTGQAYMRDPNTEVFLQITCQDKFELEIPGHSYTFEVVKESQALDVLTTKGRRALRLMHLGTDVEQGLHTLQTPLWGCSSRSKPPSNGRLRTPWLGPNRFGPSYENRRHRRVDLNVRAWGKYAANVTLRLTV